MLKAEHAFYLLFSVLCTVIYFIHSTEENLVISHKFSRQNDGSDSEDEKELLENEFSYRRAVLKRACSVVGDLDQISKNGTSFQELIRIHRLVQDLNQELWIPQNQCYEPVQDTGRRFVIYEIFNRNNLTETR